MNATRVGGRRGGGARCLRVAVLAMGLLMPAVAGADQGAADLAALTVPGDRLPAGCTLASDDPPPASPRQDRVVVRAVEPGTPPTNPWSGTDRALIGHIRERIDGAPPMPDGPPLDRAATATWKDEWNRHVVGAYRARYVAGREPPVEVFAVQFDDAARAQPSPLSDVMSAARALSARVVRGAAVIVVRSSAAGGCYRAIVDYVSSRP